MSEKGGVVASFHEGEYGVAATLEGNVEVGHEGTAVGTEVHDLVGEQIGLDARDAVAFDAFDAIECADELCEALAGGASEITDVHAGEHNFASAVGCGLFGLCNDFGNGGIARATARSRDGAVGTIIVAAVLHFEKIACAVAARAGGHERLDVAQRGGVVDAAVRLAVGTHAELFGFVVLFDEFDEAAFLLLPDDEVYAFNLCDVLAGELRVATHDGDEGSGMLAVETADGVPAFGVGFAGDATRVDNTDIGLFALGRGTTSLAETIAQSGGLGIVEFAAQGDEGGFLIIYRG